MAGMAKFRRFLAVIMSDWLARMSGPLTVPFAVAAFLLPSVAARVLFAVLAVIAALITCYRVWVKEYDRAEAEKVKNEIAPDIDIHMRCMIPHGAMGSGMTDLFVSAALVLKAPSQVSVRDFSLEVFNNDQSLTVAAVDDMNDWELTKREMLGQHRHLPCVPLTKSLTQRGDPVQGWIHFTLPHLSVHLVETSGLNIKVNCAHGTCVTQVAGAYARSDPDTKGTMRKKIVT